VIFPPEGDAPFLGIIYPALGRERREYIMGKKNRPEQILPSKSSQYEVRCTPIMLPIWLNTHSVCIALGVANLLSNLSNRGDCHFPSDSHLH
jgi:hypothetical protein